MFSIRHFLFLPKLLRGEKTANKAAKSNNPPEFDSKSKTYDPCIEEVNKTNKLEKWLKGEVRDKIINEISIGSLNWNNEVVIMTSFLDSLFQKDEWMRCVEFDRIRYRAAQNMEDLISEF